MYIWHVPYCPHWLGAHCVRCTDSITIGSISHGCAPLQQPGLTVRMQKRMSNKMRAQHIPVSDVKRCNRTGGQNAEENEQQDAGATHSGQRCQILQQPGLTVRMQKRMSNEMWGTAIPVMSDAATCGLYTCQQRPGHQYIQSQTYLCSQHSLCIAMYQNLHGKVAFLALTLYDHVSVFVWPGTSICMTRYQSLHSQVPVSV